MSTANFGLCLRWATVDKFYIILFIEHRLREIKVKLCYYYEFLPFSSVLSTVILLRSIILNMLFTDKFP